MSNVQKYWEYRYKTGGNSGAGSYGDCANFKAAIISSYIKSNNVKSVIDLGVGDGNVLTLLDDQYQDYYGLDISKVIIKNVEKKFPHRKFYHYNGSLKEYQKLKIPPADLVLSLDVIFHLTDDQVFDSYMNILWQSSRKAMIVYSSNNEMPSKANHVKHRKWTDWLENRFKGLYSSQLITHPYKDKSFSDVYIIEKLKGK